MATGKKRSRKKVSKASRDKAIAKVLVSPADEEVDTFIFCRHPRNKYIASKITWQEFRAGNLDQLRFHEADLPELPLKTEMELFAEGLNKYLLGLGYAGIIGARYQIRGAIGDKSDPMQNLLTVIADSYKS
jgi:hypothetical protein